MVISLDRFGLRICVSWCAIDSSRIFIKRPGHLFQRWLLFIMGILCPHYSWSRFLIYQKYTIPSSKTILLAVYHLLRRSKRGSALWNPVPSKQVIPSSLLLAWIAINILLLWYSIGRAAEGRVFPQTSCPSKTFFRILHTLALRTPSIDKIINETIILV
jgi:hypothetical protein